MLLLPFCAELTPAWLFQSALQWHSKWMGGGSLAGSDLLSGGHQELGKMNNPETWYPQVVQGPQASAAGPRKRDTGAIPISLGACGLEDSHDSRGLLLSRPKQAKHALLCSARTVPAQEQAPLSLAHCPVWGRSGTGPHKAWAKLTLYTWPYVPLPTTSTSSNMPAGSCRERERESQVQTVFNTSS